MSRHRPDPQSANWRHRGHHPRLEPCCRDWRSDEMVSTQPSRVQGIAPPIAEGLLLTSPACRLPALLHCLACPCCPVVVEGRDFASRAVFPFQQVARHGPPDLGRTLPESARIRQPDASLSTSFVQRTSSVCRQASRATGLLRDHHHGPAKGFRCACRIEKSSDAAKRRRGQRVCRWRPLQAIC